MLRLQPLPAPAGRDVRRRPPWRRELAVIQALLQKLGTPGRGASPQAEGDGHPAEKLRPAHSTASSPAHQVSPEDPNYLTTTRGEAEQQSATLPSSSAACLQHLDLLDYHCTDPAAVAPATNELLTTCWWKKPRGLLPRLKPQDLNTLSYSLPRLRRETFVPGPG